MAAPKSYPATTFDKAKQEAYLSHLRGGALKYEAARLAGIGYRTVQRRRAVDPDFVDEEREALAEAREAVEKVVYNSALQGDLSAAKMWLQAHDKSTYGDRRTVEVDATPAALEMSRNEVLAKLAELQATITGRLELKEAEAVLDLPSEEA